MTIRLTVGMLKAMEYALMEFNAGEGPMGGETEEECEKLMNDSDRAADWVSFQLNKREAAEQAKGKRSDV